MQVAKLPGNYMAEMTTDEFNLFNDDWLKSELRERVMQLKLTLTEFFNKYDAEPSVALASDIRIAEERDLRLEAEMREWSKNWCDEHGFVNGV